MNDFYNIFRATDWRVTDTPDAARLYHVRTGEVTLTLTDGRIPLREGYTYLIPAYAYLAEKAADGALYDAVCISPNVMTEHLMPLAGCARSLAIDSAFAATLFDHTAGGTPLRAERSLALLLALFAESAHADFAVSGTNIGKFLPVFDYIDEHIKGSVALPVLADLTGSSKVYFSNLFKKTFDLSPQQYILQRKASLACQMLADASPSATSVAAALDFYDPAAFTAFFKKTIGMTPRAYRAWLLET